MAGVNSYATLETKKVKGIGRGNFAAVLIPRQNEEEFVLKEIFCNFQRKSKF